MPFKIRLAKICEALDITFYPEKHELLNSDVVYAPSISFRNTFYIQHYYRRKKEKLKLILLKIEILRDGWRISLETDEDFYPLEIASGHIPKELYEPLMKASNKLRHDLLS